MSLVLLIPAQLAHRPLLRGGYSTNPALSPLICPRVGGLDRGVGRGQQRAEALRPDLLLLAGGVAVERGADVRLVEQLVGGDAGAEVVGHLAGAGGVAADVGVGAVGAVGRVVEPGEAGRRG